MGVFGRVLEIETGQTLPAAKIDRTAIAMQREAFGDIDRQAQETLKRLYAETRSSGRRAGRQSPHSWKSVADSLKENTGYVYRVATGKRRASNHLLGKLGLHPRAVLVEPCPHCGNAPLKKQCGCTRKPSGKKRLPPPLVRLVAGLLASGHLQVTA